MSRDLVIKQGFIAKQKMIQSLLGDKKKADKFVATAVQISQNKNLQGCTPESIIEACINVAQMGLDLSPTLSHAYLAPFKSSVQLIVSVRGYSAMLARTGWKLKSFIVNEGDNFEYKIDGFTEAIKFSPNIDNEDEKFKYAVAMAQSPDGEFYVEIMNKAKIEKHRKVSQNQKGDKPTGIWADWYNEMATKTVTKKLAKRLPIGEDISHALSVDDKPIEAEIVSKEADTDLNDLMTAPHTPKTVDSEKLHINEVTGEISSQ